MLLGVAMNVLIRPDFPRGRTPICLILDDPCPCINPLYYFRLQVDRIPSPPDEPTLTRYFAEAMSILNSAGLPNNGLTQPCTFVGDEAMYARAILAAEKAVNGRTLTHNFLHVDSAGSQVWPRLSFWRPEAGEA